MGRFIFHEIDLEFEQKKQKKTRQKLTKVEKNTEGRNSISM